MKLSTRQYSRRQMKWIRRRFLLNSRSPPAVYRVDSSDPSRWQEKVYQPAEIIVRDFIEGRRPEMEPVERIDGGEERQEDCRRTMHCDVCDRDFKGAAQYRNHVAGSSHRKVARATTDKVIFVMNLTSFKEENRNGVAKIIKNTFGIGLTEVFAKMDSLPAVLTNVVGEAKASNIAKELSKQGIVIEVEKKIESRDRVELSVENRDSLEV
eukprot:GFUD01067008.1.p1 GENE.GFUD01067008.1~~GFUD01067008.1.p1  ORF type:complete len:210 (+),score=76.12 GFUD01067008.1:2-631(+)